MAACGARAAERAHARVGVFMPGDENDRLVKVSAFLGWTDGRNVRMDLRWHDDDTNRTTLLDFDIQFLH